LTGKLAVDMEARMQIAIKSAVKTASKEISNNLDARVQSAVATMIRNMWVDLHHPGPITAAESDADFNFYKKAAIQQLLGLRMFIWQLYSVYVINSTILHRIERAIDQTENRLKQLEFRPRKERGKRQKNIQVKWAPKRLYQAGTTAKLLSVN